MAGWQRSFGPDERRRIVESLLAGKSPQGPRGPEFNDAGFFATDVVYNAINIVIPHITFEAHFNRPEGRFPIERCVGFYQEYRYDSLELNSALLGSHALKSGDELPGNVADAFDRRGVKFGQWYSDSSRQNPLYPLYAPANPPDRLAETPNAATRDSPLYSGDDRAIRLARSFNMYLVRRSGGKLYRIAVLPWSVDLHLDTRGLSPARSYNPVIAFPPIMSKIANAWIFIGRASQSDGAEVVPKPRTV